MMNRFNNKFYHHDDEEFYCKFSAIIFQSRCKVNEIFMKQASHEINMFNNSCNREHHFNLLLCCVELLYVQLLFNVIVFAITI